MAYAMSNLQHACQGCVSTSEIKSSFMLSARIYMVHGASLAGSDSQPVNDTEGEQAVTMETVAVEGGEVSDGDGQRVEEASGASAVKGQVDDVVQRDDETKEQRSSDGPQPAADIGQRQDDDDELVQSQATIQRHSLDGSTEPPADCNHSSPPGSLHKMQMHSTK